MNNLEALKALLAKVEAGEVHNYASTFAIVRCLNTQFDTSILNDLLVKAYTSDLNAAKALHEAVLPGWSWVKPDGPEMGSIRVFGPDNGDFYPSAIGKASNPARAWLIAILKALIAECDE